MLFSVEPRRTVWKRSETKGMDIFGFGDAGQVWGDNRSATNPQILANDVTASQNWRFGIGGGVQYRMSKSMAFRIDIAHSNESNRVYLSLTRGF
jgi:outer membrane protein assembly factor BamA